MCAFYRSLKIDVDSGVWIVAVFPDDSCADGLKFGVTLSSSKLPLIAWAIGEMPALFGGVFYLLTGDWTIYMTGLVGLVAAFALFPVPRQG